MNLAAGFVNFGRLAIAHRNNHNNNCCIECQSAQCPRCLLPLWKAQHKNNRRPPPLPPPFPHPLAPCVHRIRNSNFCCLVVALTANRSRCFMRWPRRCLVMNLERAKATASCGSRCWTCCSRAPSSSHCSHSSAHMCRTRLRGFGDFVLFYLFLLFNLTFLIFLFI